MCMHHAVQPQLLRCAALVSLMCVRLLSLKRFIAKTKCITEFISTRFNSLKLKCARRIHRKKDFKTTIEIWMLMMIFPLFLSHKLFFQDLSLIFPAAVAFQSSTQSSYFSYNFKAVFCSQLNYLERMSFYGNVCIIIMFSQWIFFPHASFIFPARLAERR